MSEVTLCSARVGFRSPLELIEKGDVKEEVWMVQLPPDDVLYYGLPITIKDYIYVFNSEEKADKFIDDLEVSGGVSKEKRLFLRLCDEARANKQIIIDYDLDSPINKGEQAYSILRSPR